MRQKLIALLFFSIVAISISAMEFIEQEPQKPQETIEAEDNEEVTNLIFDTWYVGKDICNYCVLFNGQIDLVKRGGQIYLYTTIKHEVRKWKIVEIKGQTFLKTTIWYEPKKVDKIILSAAISEAMDKKYKRIEYGSGLEKWKFVDAKTRCSSYKFRHKRMTTRCLSHFTKEEFAERLQRKEQEKNQAGSENNF